MNKILIIVVVFLLVIIGFLFFSQISNQKKLENTDKIINSVTFNCAENKNINAIFFSSKVELTLSDGRTMFLAQAISASGARYANTDESFVFWNKGDTAFITEGTVATFNDCTLEVLEATSSSQISTTLANPLTDLGELNTKGDKQGDLLAIEWLTYKSDKYGFEFKYPSDYYIAGETITGGDDIMTPSVFHILLEKEEQMAVSLYVLSKEDFDLEKENQKASKISIVSKNTAIKLFEYIFTDYFGNVHKHDGIIGEKYSIELIKDEVPVNDISLLDTIENSFTWLSNNP